MKHGTHVGTLALLLSATAFAIAPAFAQLPQQQQPGQQPGQQQPGQVPGQPTNPNNPNNPGATPSPDLAPPVNAEEDAAFKAFRDEQDATKQEQLANDFIQKYPQSRYLPEIYNWQVRLYYRKGDVDRMDAAADKQLAVFPNDPQTLAIVGTTLPRAWNASLTDEQKTKRLEKAEKYCQKSLELLPTITKPDGMPDDKFKALKDETAAMAYAGLGLVAFRRGKFSDAIPNLENAVKADPQEPDPVNFYVLGKADEQTSHYDDAVTAFTKCAAIQSGIKDTCTQSIEEAKKLGATKLSSPK
jgi:tetratricopeptide (TPR) repeat protein